MVNKCYMEVETKSKSSYYGDGVMLMTKKAYKAEKESMKKGFSPYLKIKVLRKKICDVKKWRGY